MADFSDDLRCLYESEFGVDASLLVKATNTTIQLRGIFENPYFQRKFGDFVVDAEDPSFECVFEDGLENARQGDELTIDNTVYFLQSEPQKDGVGVVAMVLTPADTQDAQGQPDPEDPSDGGTNKPPSMGGDNLFKA